MIQLDSVSIGAGEFGLEEVSLSVETGAYAILMGKTGCGKTTLLEGICGLRHVDGGMINLMGRNVTRLKPAERGIGYVPQDGALFGTMTVRRHLAFALEVRKWGAGDIKARVEELAALLQISDLLDRKPHGLSGGERQRVALGRALSFHPPVLCLDEPLSALDHETRLEMCDLLEAVKNEFKVTVLHVTHDLNEAARLADVLFEIVEGRIVETNGKL